MKLNIESIKEAMVQLIQNYQLTPNQILDIAQKGIKVWFRRDYPEFKKADLGVAVQDNGDVKLFRKWEVVETVEDPETQILFEDAKKIRDDITLWESIVSDVTPETMELSRIATISAAQAITQELKAVEKELFQQKFKNSIGKLLKAKVIKVADSTILLEIDGNPVILPPEGQIPQKKYEEGEEIFVFLKGGFGKDMLPDLSETNKEYIEAILKLMIPEIAEEKIAIEKIARRPWIRTKVLLKRVDEHIDPVSAAVWLNGERAREINELLSYKAVWKTKKDAKMVESDMNETLLLEEKVEFIEQVDDRETLIKKCLLPAEVQKIVYTKNKDGEDCAEVYIKDNKQALAIGKKNSNVQTASEIVGIKIDIR